MIAMSRTSGEAKRECFSQVLCITTLTTHEAHGALQVADMGEIFDKSAAVGLVSARREQDLALSQPSSCGRRSRQGVHSVLIPAPTKNSLKRTSLSLPRLKSSPSMKTLYFSARSAIPETRVFCGELLM